MSFLLSGLKSSSCYASNPAMASIRPKSRSVRYDPFIFTLSPFIYIHPIHSDGSYTCLNRLLVPSTTTMFWSAPHRAFAIICLQLLPSPPSPTPWPHPTHWGYADVLFYAGSWVFLNLRRLFFFGSLASPWRFFPPPTFSYPFVLPQAWFSVQQSIGWFLPLNFAPNFVLFPLLLAI